MDDPGRRRRRCASVWRVLPLASALVLSGCGDGPVGEPVRFTVPQGSGFGTVTDTLTSRGIVRNPLAFRLYARFRGVERDVKPGVYEAQRGIAWDDLFRKLVDGDVIRLTLVVPEGWTIQQIVPRLAEAANVPADSLLQVLLSEGAATNYEVPGPTLEGYLYPATYVFPLGSNADLMVRGMVARYNQVWTPERQARADSLGMSVREVVTLASIVEKEARVWGERDTIAAVYHNRLRIKMPLQADPTVQYALGNHQTRLLYEHIDQVADHPYSTYHRQGLPPGPIASPSTGAIDATLRPADVNFLYFVARPNGTHIFTRTLNEHNNARREASRLAAQSRESSR